MKPVIFNNTVLRDGHQSLAATRMTTDQMLPVARDLDGLGFGALETWGGATIDSCLRFLRENPFSRLDRLKSAAPATPQMMLLRGQNLVQYTSFPDDVVEAFVRRTAAHGLDIFRIFDALNDARNLMVPVRAVKAAGRHAQGAICYTTSPVHTPEQLAAFADQLVELGVDSICIKDMAGLLTPVVAYELVRAIKQRHSLPLVVHSHDTAGFALATYVASTDAGADAVETSIAPFANGTGQPDTVRMLAALAGHARAPLYNTQKLYELGTYFEGVAKELAAFMSPANDRVDGAVLQYQVPGGMLSNFRNQLKEMKMDTRFAEVMAEVPVVRRALGWIPLVTPTSQIVGTQAMLNVKFGRWANLAQNTIDVALGRYGRTPGPVDPELLALAAKKAGQEPVTVRPADLLAPRLPSLRAELTAKGLPVDDDTAVLYAMFPRETEALLKPPATPAAAAPAAKAPAAATPAPAPAARPAPPVSPIRGVTATARAHPGGPRHFHLTVDGRRHEIVVEEP
ncbi:MAG TPA: pyruvate carboxylase subunit B [Lacunisphaera sp.]|nr:pyruvate carboxylase subunit B [Lacunisphaera sp.]